MSYPHVSTNNSTRVTRELQSSTLATRARRAQRLLTTLGDWYRGRCSRGGSPGYRPARPWRYNADESHRTRRGRSGPMNVLLLSMPDSFEHMPAVAIRMPNGALSSLAGNVDPHHRVA